MRVSIGIFEIPPGRQDEIYSFIFYISTNTVYSLLAHVITVLYARYFNNYITYRIVRYTYYCYYCYLPLQKFCELADRLSEINYLRSLCGPCLQVLRWREEAVHTCGIIFYTIYYYVLLLIPWYNIIYYTIGIIQLSENPFCPL